MKCFIFILDNTVLSVIFIISFYWVDLMISLINLLVSRVCDWTLSYHLDLSVSFISEFILDLVLMKKTLYSFLWHIFIICFKFIQMFRSRFSARATLITHTAFDWLFRHASLSIKTGTSILKGSNRV